MKRVLVGVGVLAVAAGLLFTGQGLGYIHWPASSFMISDMTWAYYGGAIALVGFVLIAIGRR